MNLKRLTLIKIFLISISVTIILTSIIFWFLFKKSQEIQYENSLKNIAKVLIPVSNATKWKVLFKEEYNKSLLKYFLEEGWEDIPDISFIGSYFNNELYLLYSNKNYEQARTNMQAHIKNIIKELISKSSFNNKDSFISRKLPQKELKLFVYPVYKSDTFNEKNILFDPMGNSSSQKKAISYTIIGISTTHMKHTFQNIFFLSVAITLAIILFGIFISFIISKFINTSISKLIYATQKIAKADYSHKLEKLPYYDLNLLANSINTMADKIKESDSLKEQFLLNMSHELRTPLNSIVGFSNILAKNSKDKLDHKEQRALAFICSHSDHLLQLINAMLDLAKIRAGKMDVFYEEVNLSDFLKEIEEITLGYINTKPINFVLKTDKSINTIQTDKLILKQILINLLSNAVKFTNSGEIKLICNKQVDSLQFIISDTGKGIKKEDLDKIFDRFHQLESEKNQKKQGTGIGLSLVKELINLLKGKINVSSEIDKGTIFYISLLIKTNL